MRRVKVLASLGSEKHIGQDQASSQFNLQICIFRRSLQYLSIQYPSLP